MLWRLKKNDQFYYFGTLREAIKFLEVDFKQAYCFFYGNSNSKGKNRNEATQKIIDSGLVNTKYLASSSILEIRRERVVVNLS
jgi:hypothetical protein